MDRTGKKYGGDDEFWKSRIVNKDHNPSYLMMKNEVKTLEEN